jgi:hypothetical protein
MGFGCPYCGWCKLSLNFSSGRFLLDDQCEHLVLGHSAFQNSTQLWKHPVMGRILPSEQVADLLPRLRLLPDIDATRFLLSWLFDGKRPSGYVPPTAATLQRSMRKNNHLRSHQMDQATPVRKVKWGQLLGTASFDLLNENSSSKIGDKTGTILAIRTPCK